MVYKKANRQLNLCHNARESVRLFILQVKIIITRMFLQLPQTYEFVKGDTNSWNMTEGEEILKFGRKIKLPLLITF